MRVKVYTAAPLAEVGFDSLEWLLERLCALADLTPQTREERWLLWLGAGCSARWSLDMKAFAESCILRMLVPMALERAKPIA
jgi:hypothetical protein